MLTRLLIRMILAYVTGSELPLGQNLNSVRLIIRHVRALARLLLTRRELEGPLESPERVERQMQRIAQELADRRQAAQGEGPPQEALTELEKEAVLLLTGAGDRKLTWDTGTIIINMETVPADQAGSFTVTGVPSATLTTEVDPAPDFQLTAVTCDDGGAGLASRGDAGEAVTCTFLNESAGTGPLAGGSGGSGSNGGTGGDSGKDDGGANPFQDPDPDFEDFPQPDELPPDAGTWDLDGDQLRGSDGLLGDQPGVAHGTAGDRHDGGARRRSHRYRPRHHRRRGHHDERRPCAHGQVQG